MGTLVSIVLFGLAAYSLVRRYGRWKDRGGERGVLERLRHTPASLIADADEGIEIRIEGRVRLLHAAYETTCFAVEDESGRAVIRAEGARLLLYPTLLRQQSTREMEPAIADFIKQHGIAPSMPSQHLDRKFRPMAETGAAVIDVESSR